MHAYMAFIFGNVPALLDTFCIYREVYTYDAGCRFKNNTVVMVGGGRLENCLPPTPVRR